MGGDVFSEEDTHELGLRKVGIVGRGGEGGRVDSRHREQHVQGHGVTT